MWRSHIVLEMKRLVSVFKARTWGSSSNPSLNSILPVSSVVTQLAHGVYHSHAPISIYLELTPSKISSERCVAKPGRASVRHNVPHCFHALMTHMTVEVTNSSLPSRRMLLCGRMRWYAPAATRHLAVIRDGFRDGIVLSPGEPPCLILEVSPSTIPDGYSYPELLRGVVSLLCKAEGARLRAQA